MPLDSAQRDRREIKYVISEHTALAVRAFVNCYIEPDECAQGKLDNSYPVHSLYLDSDRLDTFWAVEMGERNRFKLRIRYYDDLPESPVFCEIKRRINDGIVKQRARVRRDAIGPLLDGTAPRREHLHKWKPQDWADLLDFWELVERYAAAPRLHNYYMREAYVSRGKTDVRVTLDRSVQVEPEFGSELQATMKNPHIIFNGVVILELKYVDRMPAWMIEMVRGFDLKRSSAAKYVTGVETLGQQNVARRRTGFEWGSAVTNVATSVPWLDASIDLRRSIGPGGNTRR
jgi:SPX domain protein involved in polyphosphate accumulation